MQQGLAPSWTPHCRLAGGATSSGTESKNDNIGTGGTGYVAGVIEYPTAGSTMGVTIAGKTPTSKRVRATSKSTPEVIERGMDSSMADDGEPTGVGRSSSRSVPGSTSGATPSSGQINPSKSPPPHWTMAHVRGEVHPYRPTPPEAGSSTRTGRLCR